MKEMKNIRKIFLLTLFLLINSLIFALNERFNKRIDTGLYKFIYIGSGYTKYVEEIIIQEYKNREKNGVFKKQNIAGETVLKAYYKNDKLNGAAEEYDEKGKVKTRTEFKDGEKNGVSESFGANGKVLVRERYVNGILEGVKENFRDDGSLFSTIEYKNGKRDGEVKYYYENGELLGEGRVREENPYGDVMLGIWKGYYPDGKLKKEVKFNEEGTEADVKTYFQNGKISTEGKMIGKFDSWKKTGIWKYYYENGNLKYEKEVYESHPQLSNYLKGYYSNGKPEYIEEKGENSKLTTYYENGNIRMIEYENGVREAYYPNGQMQYKTGVPSEDDLFYTPEGKLISQEKEDN